MWQLLVFDTSGAHINPYPLKNMSYSFPLVEVTAIGGGNDFDYLYLRTNDIAVGADDALYLLTGVPGYVVPGTSEAGNPGVKMVKRIDLSSSWSTPAATDVFGLYSTGLVTDGVFLYGNRATQYNPAYNPYWLSNTLARYAEDGSGETVLASGSGLWINMPSFAMHPDGIVASGCYKMEAADADSLFFRSASRGQETWPSAGSSFIPRGLACDSTGYLYTVRGFAETADIGKYSFSAAAGLAFLSSFGELAVEGDTSIADFFSYVAGDVGCGSLVYGNVPGQLNFGYHRAANDLCIDEQDRIYVADTFGHAVKVYDTNGNLLQTIGFGGARPAYLDCRNNRLAVLVLNCGTYYPSSDADPEYDEPQNDWFYGRNRERLDTAVDRVSGREYVVYESGLVIYLRWRFLNTSGWSDPVQVSEAGQSAIKPGIAVHPSGCLHVVYELPLANGTVVEKTSTTFGATW